MITSLTMRTLCAAIMYPTMMPWMVMTSDPGDSRDSDGLYGSGL
jgi:hypothetical protein